jgi:hypothetical protein
MRVTAHSYGSWPASRLRTNGELAIAWAYSRTAVSRSTGEAAASSRATDAASMGGQHVVGRAGGATGPVAVEVPRDLGHDRPDRQHVEVGERDALARVEVLVADVPPADDGGPVVGGERLAVHAPVQPREVGEVAEQAPAAVPEGVEQAHLDVGVRV